jgi:hypothetical protein
VIISGAVARHQLRMLLELDRFVSKMVSKAVSRGNHGQRKISTSSAQALATEPMNTRSTPAAAQ